MNKKKRILTLFILVFLMGVVVNPILLFSSFGQASVQEQDSSIEWGDNIFQNIPYWFSGTFYENTDPTFAFTNAKIDYVYIPDPTVTYSHAITSFENTEQETPTDISDITLNGNTTIYDDDKMDANDNAYSYFDRDGYGDYNATYSFNEDDVGSDPSGWTIDETGGPINIIYEKNNHKKVVELYDSGANQVIMENSFTAQTSGTIEFWVRSSDTTKGTIFYLFNDAVSVLHFRIDTDDWNAYSGGFQVVTNAFDDVWYHVRLDFECTSGSYNGLSQYDYHLYINGIHHGDYDFASNEASVNKFKFNSDNSDSLYYMYIDGIDYSWEAGYSDNRNAEPRYSFYNYPGTYSFENDTIFREPDDWTSSNSADSSSIIKPNINEHERVLQLYDGDASGVADIENTFTSQVNGTIEFWWGTSNTSKYVNSYFCFKSTSTFIILGGRFQYYDGGWQDTGFTLSNNILYHHSIDFDYNTNLFNWYIDGTLEVLQGDLGRGSSINGIQLYTDSANSDYFAYYDAIGYSWDSNYILGDNLHYNYYLGNQTFEGYNQTYEGDYYGTESFDYYTEPDVYYGTYDFRDDIVGSEPSGWTSNNAAGCTTTVIASEDGHNKVLELYDNNAAGSSNIYNEFGSATTSGTVEWWVKIDDVTKELDMYLQDLGVSTAVQLKIEFDKWYEYSGGGWNIIAGDIPIDDTWYHVRVDFDSTPDTYDLYINAVDRGNFPFRAASAEVDVFTLITEAGDSAYYGYIDAVGYSWDTTSHSGLGYEVGYNINPYDIEPLLEWGYDPQVAVGTSVNIESTVGGHNNVLKLYDNTATDNIDIWDEFGGTKIDATFEFWLRKNSIASSSELDIYFYEDAGGLNTILFNTDDILYHDGGGWQTLKANCIAANVWYHIKIIFDDTNDQFDFYLDGVLEGDNLSYRVGSTVGFDDLRLMTSAGDSGYSGYIDALSYSWDSSYDVGDNINSHGKEVITALENNGWTITQVPYVSVGISGEYNSHKKILNLTDDTTSGQITISDSLTEQTYGTVEYWFQTSDATLYTTTYLYDSGTLLLALSINTDKFRYYDGGWNDVGLGALDDTWYHIRIDFECTAGGYQGLAQYDWQIYVDGVHYGDYDFGNNQPHVDTLSIKGSDGNSGYSSYFDALSYSWDYPIGTNLHANEEIVINTVISIPFAYYNREVMQLNIDSRHFTSISANTSFSIYNFTSSSWVLIDNDIYTSETLVEYDTISYDGIGGLFDSNGNMRFKYYGFNSSAFNLKIDQLTITIYFKTVLKYEKTLKLLGTWKYKIRVDVGLGSAYNQSWIYFNVIEQQPNFEGISESKYTTKWVLTSTTTTGYTVESYADDLTSNYWDLSDFSNRYFIEYPDNYLRNNDSFYDSSFESPAQWGDFGFSPYGSGTTVGELETNNDASYSVVANGWYWGTETYLGTIRPFDADINTDWNEADAAPHWSKLDEELAGDDGGNIRETDDFISDRWKFSTRAVPAGSLVTKVTIHFRIKNEIDSSKKINYGGYVPGLFFSGSGVTGTTSYSWVSKTHTGLSGSQADLDNLELVVYPFTGSGWVDLEAVYLDIYTTPQIKKHDWYATWDVVDPNSIDFFHYDYRTTVAKDLDLDIYNWDTTSWLELESNTDTNWHTGSYTLTDPYISVTEQVKIRFQSATHTAAFNVEMDQIAFEYNRFFSISKNYYNTSGEGYAYMQTNITEILGLKSPVYSTDKSLNEGDFFIVDLQTTSDNAQLKLYDNGALQKTLNVLIANAETSRQEVEVYVDSVFTFDQVKITSSLIDTEYLKLYDINAIHWIFESEQDQKTLYINPFGKGEIIANLGNNSLKIYDNDILQTDTYITITNALIRFIYQAPLPETVFVSFYDSNNEFLEFTKFQVFVDYIINEVAFTNQRLTNREFFVDEGSTIYFDVYDSFNSSIYQTNRLAKTFIDITLNVYELKIKNEKLVPVEYKLTNNDTAIIKSGYLFEDEILEYNIATGTYIFEYLKEGESTWENFTFSFTSNQIFVLNRSKICFLAYVNQMGEHLFFDDYKTYINGSLIYENVFYREIGVIIGIEIKDIYDISIKNETYTVVSGDNYIPVVLTQYSLKVMNQQEIFNHINITRDPNYYESSYYWSEWIAPNEIIKFRLFPGYYKINLTDNEGGSFSFYAYTLSDDDILLISSDNIISQVIYNIANVNTTIGNQITNVEINITNQNSAINNSIINVDINLGNVNSTLGNLLVTQGIQITNIENNITSLYVFTNNSFINLNNDMNNSFIYMENNIISINQSISNLVVGVSNDIYLINGTISTLISQLETNLLLMNVSIDTALFDLNTTLNLIGSNITSNYILLNNSITLTNTNINDSRIAIINNLALINNTISTLVSEVYSAVYLINNSIYTAVVDLGTYLSLVNNTINGNLSIVLQQNDFLTELYKMTSFSEMLNWTDVGLNTSLITSQIDAWEFINNYKNESVQVLLRYNDLIENLTVSAQNTIDQYLPKEDVEYRLKSIATGEYLNEWEALPENRSVDFGFYSTEVPDIPDLNVTNTWLMIILIIFGFVGTIGAISYGAWRYYKQIKRYKSANSLKANLNKDMTKSFASGNRIK